MTPETIARVDAWLAEREDNSPLAKRWSVLAESWQLEVAENLPAYARVTEAALTGILLALVREAWGDRYASAWGTRDGWGVESRSGLGLADGCDHDTEADALLSALEAAPAKEAR